MENKLKTDTFQMTNSRVTTSFEGEWLFQDVQAAEDHLHQVWSAMLLSGGGLLLICKRNQEIKQATITEIPDPYGDLGPLGTRDDSGFPESMMPMLRDKLKRRQPKRKQALRAFIYEAKAFGAAGKFPDGKFPDGIFFQVRPCEIVKAHRAGSKSAVLEVLMMKALTEKARACDAVVIAAA